MSAAYVLVCPECGATVPSKNNQACPSCKSPKPVPDGWHADEWLGKTVQSYNFQRRLGSGGYGKVYEVTRGRAGRETRALKLISKDLFAGTDGKRVRERFEREVEVLGRLDHPHIVRCYDHGAFEEANWLYMELDLAPGRSLYQRVWPPNADEPACLSVQEALLMGQQIADALAYAHGEGILHRDLSHNNVMLDGHGDGLKIKLIDFGPAKLLGDAKPGTRGEGTPDYMAPEQFLLGAVSDDHDARLDLYQLGGLLHFALTGQPPYSEQPGPSGTTSPIAVQQKLRQGGPGPAPSEHRPELAREAPALDALIARLLSTSPQDRPKTATEVLAQLGKLQQATQPEPLPAPLPKRGELAAWAAKVSTRQPPQSEPQPAPPDAPPKPAQPAFQPTSREASLVTSAKPPTPTQSPWRVLGVLGAFGALSLAALLVAFGLYRALEPDPKTRYPGMVYIPEGKFTLGSNIGEDDEKPAREIYLSEYWIDTYEVTVDQYRACVDAGKCSKPDTSTPLCGRWSDVTNNWTQNRGVHPVNCVSWTQADQYCRWAGKRLPTEAQWEKAARGTDGRAYPWGEQKSTCEYAVMAHGGMGCGKSTTWSVGSKPKGASPYGGHDMFGNVSEWVSDWYSSDAYQSAPERDPEGPKSGSERVNRGGDFGSVDLGKVSWPRAANRNRDEPANVNNDLGFRCARSSAE